MGSNSSRIEAPAAGSDWPVQIVNGPPSACIRSEPERKDKDSRSRSGARSGGDMPPPPYDPGSTPRMSPSSAAAPSSVRQSGAPADAGQATPAAPPVATTEVKKSRKQRKAETKLAKTQAVLAKEEAKRAKKQDKTRAKAEKTARKAKTKAEKSARSALKKARKAQVKAEHSSENVPKRVQKAHDKAVKAERRAFKRAEKAALKAQVLATRATSYATTLPPADGTMKGLDTARQRAIVSSATATPTTWSPAASPTARSTRMDDPFNPPTPPRPSSPPVLLTPPISHTPATRPAASPRPPLPWDEGDEAVFSPSSPSTTLTGTSMRTGTGGGPRPTSTSTSHLMRPRRVPPPPRAGNDSDFPLSPSNTANGQAYGYVPAYGHGYASSAASTPSGSDAGSPLTPPDSPSLFSAPRAPATLASATSTSGSGAASAPWLVPPPLPPRAPPVPPLPRKPPLVAAAMATSHAQEIQDRKREQAYHDLKRDLRQLRL